MADENTNLNDVKAILTMPIAIVVLSIIIAIYLLTTVIVPNVKSYIELSNSYKTAKDSYDQTTQRIETLKESNAAAVEAASNTEGIDKDFFRPLEAGVDSESILATEFNEILQLMISNAIKTRSVKYTYDPADDNFIKGAGSKFSVCQLDMEMIASYSNFKNFMKDLYKHEHYLDIAYVEITPYQKNKSILLINLKLKLYAEKI